MRSRSVPAIHVGPLNPATMRGSFMRRQRDPFEPAAKALLRSAKGETFKQVRRVEQGRRAGTNPLHKAQYIQAFIEARAAMLSHQQQVDVNALVALDERRVGPVTQLSSLAKELEVAAPTAFGGWRTAPDSLQRQSRAADFVLHCVLREARTPPGWSFEAFSRELPPLEKAPMRAVVELVREARSVAQRGDVASEEAFVKQLRERYEAICRGAKGFVLTPPQQQALTSILLQRLVAETGTWRLAHAYLLLHLASSVDLAAPDGGATAAAAAVADTRRDVSQQVAVFAEAVRFVDLRGRAQIPFEAVEALMERAHQLLARGAAAARRPGGGRLAPVVAAPLLSILSCPRGEDHTAVTRFCERYLFHYRRQRVYMPALAWGELLRAMGRAGASLKEVQAATDEITDPARTQLADTLISSVHVWNGYLASTKDAAHALEVFESNRRHYGLRETPATVAVLMEVLARHGSGAESIAKGMALYRNLQASAGGKVIGTASVLAALVSLMEVSLNLKELLRLCVDFHEVLVYFGVPERWWSVDTAGSSLHQRINSVAETDLVVLLECVPEYVGYFNAVCAQYTVPPVVQHALQDALGRVEAALREQQQSASESASSGGGAGAPLVSAEDLADLM